jgi:RNA polymerase sigma-70 factor (sigma-E family)
VSAPNQTRATGDHSEFDDYVRTRRPMLMGVAYGITGNVSDAEDLLQSGLVKAYVAWDRIREKGATDAYMRRVLANTRISWWRRRTLQECPLDHVPEPGAVWDAFAELDLRDALRTALSGLSKRQRAIVVLRYYSGLSVAETAAELGVSAGTVKSTLHRALAKLRVDPGLRPQVSADRPQLTLVG